MKIRSSFILFVLFGLMALSCASAPEAIPDDLTPAELIQKAQQAAEKNDYENGIRYYQALLDRYPDNLTTVCAAEYEIAFIRYKQKDYAEAGKRFKVLLARYAGPDSALLPTEFKVLSDKLLIEIELAGK